MGCQVSVGSHMLCYWVEKEQLVVFKVLYQWMMPGGI